MVFKRRSPEPVMLTPAFEISQDGATITIIIKAPFAKVSDTEIYIEGCEFKFYSKPYYLRLNLPGEILEDGRESAKYDSDKGCFTVRVPKATRGEHFEGLDMLTRLLAPSGAVSAQGPLIEVIDSEATSQEAVGDVEEEEDDINWEVEQVPYEEDAISLNDPKYGFANQRSGVFKRLQSELHGVIDLQNADRTPLADRHKLRVDDEDASFDEDYYLADLYNDEAIKQVLEYRPVYVDEYNQLHDGARAEDVVELSDELKEKMMKLPRKEYLLDKQARKEVLLGLVDLIFAYAYNHRTTEGEYTVESGWTVTKLSTMLSWLEAPTSVRDAVIASCRRCLCYPLHRNWKLVKRVLKDTQRILIAGRRCILRCLLEVHSMLTDTESRYILNDLYITDYCVWIQSVSDKHLRSLAKTLSEVKVQKKDVGFDLELLEHAAQLTLEENDQGDASADLTSGFQNLSLQHEATENEHTSQMTLEPKETHQGQTEPKGHSDGGPCECSGLSPSSKTHTQSSSSSEYETDSDSESSSSGSESSESDQQNGVSVSDNGECRNDAEAIPSPQNKAQNATGKQRVLIEDITEVQ